MSNQKVSELQIEEKKELMQKMAECNLKGNFEAYSVATAKEKIAEYLAKQNGKQDPGNSNADENTDSEDVNEAPPEEKAEASPKVKEEKTEKVLKCYICYSKVNKGVCTGCGFKLGV